MRIEPNLNSSFFGVCVQDNQGWSAIHVDPVEHQILEHLLDGDDSMSFGTRDEILDKESTIKQIEGLNLESSFLTKGYDLSNFEDDFSDVDVSEGELPSYDQMPDSLENAINVRKSRLSGKSMRKVRTDKSTLCGQGDFGRVGTGPSRDWLTLPRPRLRKRMKRSLFYHHHHPHYHWHPYYWPNWPIRPRHFSPFFDFSDEPEPIEPIPSISHFLPFYRFAKAERFPKFPTFLSAERFVPYPRFPKIAEYSPPSLEKLERLPEPPPVPQAISDREEPEAREVEPSSEAAPLPEPVPAPEPSPIAEPPPIPELAPIKEIPPIPEPQPKTPPNLDPKKTFGTGESNGGVKKSS